MFSTDTAGSITKAMFSWLPLLRPHGTASLLLLVLESKCHKMWLHLNARKLCWLCPWWCQEQTLCWGARKVWMAEALPERKERSTCQILPLSWIQSILIYLASSAKCSFSCFSLCFSLLCQRYTLLWVFATVVPGSWRMLGNSKKMNISVNFVWR